MHGLVSLLDPKHTVLVTKIWQELERECGLTGIQVTPFPHFSWQIAEDYKWDELRSVLGDIASEYTPFFVRTTGIALFSGEYPVIYIPVVRTDELNRLHRRIWDLMNAYGRGISPYYHPDRWMPHISLAYVDVTQSNIGCAIDRLAFWTYNWEIFISNLALVYEPSGQIGTLRYQFEFEG